MAIKNYSAAAETLIQLSGGKENFITVENCATRVRIQYKDLSKVDKKAIGEMDGVLSVIEKDGLQVVVGPGVCNKLCAAINEILSVDRAASTAAPDAPDVPEEKKKGDFLKIISDIFVPVLPAMIAGGIVQGLNNVLKSVAEARAAAAGIAATETLTAAQVWLQNYRYKNVSALQSVLASLRPAVVALIAGAGLSILKLVVFQGNVAALASVNWAGVLIFVAAFVALRTFKINPILTMLCCGAANLFVNLFC